MFLFYFIKLRATGNVVIFVIVIVNVFFVGFEFINEFDWYCQSYIESGLILFCCYFDKTHDARTVYCLQKSSIARPGGETFIKYMCECDYFFISLEYFSIRIWTERFVLLFFFSIHLILLPSTFGAQSFHWECGIST